MSAEATLIAALSGNSSVKALVGNGVFVWGGQQGANYPYITVQRISTAGARRLAGPSTLEWPRFQIECWARLPLDAINVAEAVRLAIDNVTLTGFPTITPTFQDQSGPDPDPETRNFRVQQDYLVFHAR